MDKYKEVVNDWLNSKILTKKEKDSIKRMDENTLHDAFYTNLTFGTGGMRGIMGMGTNRMNKFVIAKVTLAYGNYLLKNVKNAKTKGVVIAHDNRFNGVLFQETAAAVLNSLGIKVYIFDALRPTPELSFAIRYLRAAGGINITASHNPKEYNGCKIYNEDGCQLIVEQSNKVMEEFDKTDYDLDLNYEIDSSKFIVLSDFVDKAYYEMVMSSSINPDMDKSDITLVYSPQHGTGYIPVTTVLKKQGYNVIEVKEQCNHVGGFDNTKSPNPEEKVAYELALTYVNDNVDFVCATDPDCDRVGIVVFDNKRNPVYMSGNQTGAMLIEYLLSVKSKNNTLDPNSIIYNTIVTSPLGKIVANSYQIEVSQTLTGFKYIGDKIAKSIASNGKKFLMGYEESYGYLFNSNVRDKDGVQSVMLIAEMASYYKKQGITLYKLYEQIQQKYGYFTESQYSYQAPGESGVIKINTIMENIRNANIDSIGDYKIVSKEDYLKQEITTDNIQSKLLGHEKSNVLRFVFDDKSFVAIRPSGTEPKIKFYFACKGNSKKESLDKNNMFKEFFIKFID